MPSPTWPHPVMSAPCSSAIAATRRHVLRDGGPGHHQVHDVVRPVRLGHEERLLPGADELGGRLGRQHVDLHGAELDQQLTQRRHVLVEARLVGALEDDDEVGERLVAHRLGDAEVQADVGGDGRHGDHVDVLEDERADPAGATMRGTAAVTSSRVVNGASTVAA